ncbi:MAG: HAMP domain-containing protein, partial [Candidatus Rifleibacteriota bacterium]
MTDPNLKRDKRRIALVLPFFFMVLLIGVMMLLNYADQVLRGLILERGIADARDKLILDVKLLQKASRSENQLGSFFYDRMSRLSGNLKDSKEQFEILDQNLKSIFSAWSLSTEWLVFSFDRASYLRGETLVDKQLNVEQANGDLVTEQSEPLRFLCMKGIQAFSNRQISVPYRDFAGPKVNDLVEDVVANSQTDFIRSCLGNFAKVHLKKRPYFLAWFPLLDKEWLGSDQRFSGIDLLRFDSRDLSLLHLRGLILLAIPEKDFRNLEKQLLRKVIVWNMARIGCHLSFDENEKSSALLNARENRMLKATFRLTLDKEYWVRAWRRSDFNQSISQNSRFAGFSSKLLWFSLGVFFIGHFWVMKRSVAIPLTLQLILFTAWILFPAFYLGFNATERYFLEKQTSSFSGLKNSLQETVRAFDNSIELYKTWVCDCIDHSIEKFLRENGETIETLKGDKSKELLKYLSVDLKKNGVFSKNIFIVESHGKIHSDLFGAEKKEVKFFEQFFKAFYLPAISQKKSGTGSVESEKDNLLASAQNEELVAIACSVLPPEDLSGMAIRSVSLDRLSGLGDQAFIYHKYLGSGREANFVLQIGIFMPSLERSCMLDWMENFKESNLPGLIWVISRKNAPSWMLRSPFWKAVLAGKMGLLNPIFDFLPPDLLFWSHQVSRSNTPVATSIMYGEKEYLFANIPGQGMKDYLISAILPLKFHKDRLLAFREKLLWAMALIFFLSSFIGVLLARSFIRPVRMLASNAESVVRGNFTARMPQSYEESEFNELAQNFNQVAESLESGQTLSKFVSEGALEIIRDPGQLRNEVNSVEAAVMFIRLDGFWEKTSGLPPEQAVFFLNSFFSTVCQQVRLAGGDVSKFIGEKVLAVFYPHRTGDRVAICAANCALSISAMVSRNPEDYYGCRPRIGISVGNVLSGLIGDEDTLLEQTVIGDSVNLASRLCTLSSTEAILL